MYKHSETVAFLQSIVGQEIKVYTLNNTHEQNFIGTLKEVTSADILVDCKIGSSTKEKTFFFFNKKVHISKIITTKDYVPIYEGTTVSVEALADITNTLEPIKNLLALLESDERENALVKEQIKQRIEESEAAVEYLSNLNTF